MASKTNETMRAWLYTSASSGLEKSIKLHDDATQPQPGKGEILCRVHAMSLNPADYKLPELGLLSRAMLSPPASPGMDFAGKVIKVSDGVEGFKVGEEVFGRIDPKKFGTLGEYVVANYEGLARLPAGATFGLEEASCAGTAALTAYQCITPNIVVGNGDKVFINGGSGGTGTFGIQIAKAQGCHVTVSCSGKNADLCKSLGADDVIDYTKENISATLKAKGQVFKLVVDNVGSQPPDLYKVADSFLVPEGKYVQVGGGAGMDDIKSITTRMFLPSFLGGGKRKFEFMMTKNVHTDLEEIGTLMKEGKVKAVIDEVFDYEDAPKAIEKLKTGRTKGKIVVRGPK